MRRVQPSGSMGGSGPAHLNNTGNVERHSAEAIGGRPSEAEPARRRVAPLPPDDRRAALIEATVPLLLEHGWAISSRQIAQAAGVAEGTIFRVFPDKNSLILDALKQALDPQPGIDAFHAIPRDLELRDRATRAATHLTFGIARFGRLHMIARELVIEHGHTSEFGAQMHENNLRVQEALASVFEPDESRLRLRPTDAARLLLLIVVGMSGFGFGDVEKLDPAEIVSVLLDGIVKPDDAPSNEDPRSTPPDHSDSRPGTSRES